MVLKLVLGVCSLAFPLWALAQQGGGIGTPQPGSTEPAKPPAPTLAPVTVFPHPNGSRWFVSGQANVVFQAHAGMHSPYQGPNSFLARGEYKTSLVGTLYTGFELVQNPRFENELIFNLESSGGRGVSEALGLAGFTNLDVVRNPQLGSLPYVARLELHQTIGLSAKLVSAERTQFALATRVPVRRLDFRAGRFSLPDFFDVNGPGSDSHLQFLNWTVDNNGAWDYAADTRGYTYGAAGEYDDKDWSARYAIALMPKVANGADEEWNLRKARGENYELEIRRTPWSSFVSNERKGAVRLLGFVNHGNMGDYREAINAAAGVPGNVPAIAAHAPRTSVKYGMGASFEQDVTEDVRVFGRFGWNEGQHESFCYTEVDQTFEFGGDMTGSRWLRREDRFGVAAVTNAMKRDHQHYLQLGGLGFLLGDGRLNYAREDILEAYYTAHQWRGLFTAFDLQLIAHPGYNQDRGPVAVFAVRTHVDF